MDTTLGKSGECSTWLRLFPLLTEWELNIYIKFSYREKSLAFIALHKLWICLRFVLISHLKELSWIRSFWDQSALGLCFPRHIPHGEWAGLQLCCNNIDGPFSVLTHKRSWWGSLSLEVDINPEAALHNLWPFSGCRLKVIGWVVGS